MSSPLFIAIFGQEEHLLAATRAASRAGLRIHDAFTPYPVHGMDQAMGLGRSRLTWVCFSMGVLGLAFAMWLQSWTSAVDWPLNVGGKPMLSFPAFVPVAFELMVLFAALGTVAALLLRTGVLPGRAPRLVIDGVTNDRFALVLEVADDRFDRPAVERLLREHGALDTSLRENER
jgi:hypothetical protein